MRLGIVAALLTVLLAACGTASGKADKHQQVSANLHTPTPAPSSSGGNGKVLLDLTSASQDMTTRAFTASSSWKAHYTFQCMTTSPVYKHGVFQIYGIDPKHPNGQEEIILYALTEQKVNTGTSSAVSAGNYKLRILADPICHWHVVVKTV